jgi:hypothetical protein
MAAGKPTLRTWVLVFVLVIAVGGALAACGNDTFGTVTDPYCYSVRYASDDPKLWTREVSPGANVLLEEDHGTCDLTVQTACAAGDCSGAIVRIGGRDVAVPSLTQLAEVPAYEVRVINRGASAATVAAAISGVCQRCMVLRCGLPTPS